MKNSGFLVAILGLMFAGLLIGCGDISDPGTAPDQASKPTLQSISSRTVVPHVTAWASVSAGDSHTCAIDSNNYLWCWGWNYYGQLATGNTTDKLTPSIITLSTDWAQVSAGGDFSCARKTGGTIYCWGGNWLGQIGDGTTAEKWTPTQTGTDTNWTSMDSSWGHNCAIKSDFSLWCWGNNSFGQLGKSKVVTYYTSPIQVGKAKNWKTVATGETHTCALKKDGTLWCWGNNSKGQLGDGTTKPRSVPAQAGTAKDWSSVSAGSSHTCAKKKDGSLWCWGWDKYGQLGIGSTQAKKTPVKVGTQYAAVWAGADHTCGLKKNTGLYCWGRNGSGQLATGDNSNRHKPQLVQVPGTGYLSADAGGYHTCGLWNNGSNNEIWCWGANSDGQLGDGYTADRTVPDLVVNP